MTLVSTTALLIRRDDPLIAAGDSDIDIVRIFYFFVLYSPFVPMSFYGAYDLIILFKRINVHRDHAGHSSEPIKVLDPNTLPNLGQIDYCLIDKTGTLTTGNYNVKGVFVLSKKDPSAPAEMDNLLPRIYRIDEKFIQEKIEHYSSKKSQRQDTLQTKGSHEEDDDADDDKKELLATGRVNTETSAKGAENNLDNSKSLIIAEEDFKRDVVEKELKRTPNIHTMKHPGSGVDSSRRLDTQEADPLLLNQKVSSPDPLLKPKDVKINLGGNMGGETKKKGVQFFGGLTMNPRAALEHKGTFDAANEILSEEKFLSDYFLAPEATSHQIESLLRNLALCHSAQIEKGKYMTPYPVELSLLNFARLCRKDFTSVRKIEKKNDDAEFQYTLKEQDREEYFRILGVNDFSYSRKRSSVIYQHNNQRAVIVSKGPAEGMKQALSLSPDEWKIYDSIVSGLEKEGLKVQVIAKKELQDHERDDFIKKYKNYRDNIVYQGNELEELANTYEKGLSLVGIVALQDELRPAATETIQLLRDADIKIWMVTGDNRENAMNVAYQTGIIKKGITVKTVRIEKEEAARSTIKGLLDAVQSQYEEENNLQKSILEDKNVNKKKEEKKKDDEAAKIKTNKCKYAICIDGESFAIIDKDDYLRSNFAFVCALGYTLVGYRFSPAQKARLNTLVQTRFPDNPITLAIGDGLNDTLLLQSAHVGIELKANANILQSNAGDIQITSLEALKHLLLVNGRNISEKIEGTMHFLFYCSIFLGLPIFLYNFYCNFTGTPIFDSMLIFMYYFWFTFFAVVVYGAFDKSSPVPILLKYPALYIDGKNKKNQLWTNYVISSFAEGVIHAILVYFISIYTVELTLGNEGRTSSFGMISLVQYYSIVVIANIKLYWNYKGKMWAFFALFIFEVASLVVYMIIHHHAQFTESDYGNETSSIFRRAGSLLTLAFLIVFVTAFTYIVRHYVVDWFFQTLYDWCSEIGAGTKPNFSNDQILDKAIPPQDISHIATYVFKQMENMDNIVAHMISPVDDEELKLSPLTLEFKDKKLAEKRYSLVTARQASYWARILYPIFLIIYGGYILGASILEEESTYGFSRFSVFLGFLCFGIILYTDFYRVYYFKLTLFYVFGAISLKLIYDWTRVQDSSFAACLVPIITATLFNVRWYQTFILHFIHWIVFEVR